MTGYIKVLFSPMASRRLGSSLTVTLSSLLITEWPPAPRMSSILSFMSTRHSRPVSGFRATGQGRYLSRCTSPILRLGTSSNLNLPQGPWVMEVTDVMVTVLVSALYNGVNTDLVALFV